jgi:hypothetical protein
VSNIKFAKAGENSNPNEYADPTDAKVVPTPSCVTKEGKPIYASDGCTVEWNPLTPHVKPARG